MKTYEVEISQLIPVKITIEIQANDETEAEQEAYENAHDGTYNKEFELALADAEYWTETRIESVRAAESLIK